MPEKGTSGSDSYKKKNRALKAEIKKRLALIKMILLDNDGVLTDGRLIYGKNGVEYVMFDVKDGLGIKLAQKGDIKIGIISGLKSEALEKRASMLDAADLFMNVWDKKEIYEEIKRKHNLTDEQIAFIGDDVLDVPVMKRCGVAVAVADAHTAAKEAAHIITSRPGGRGAVREFIDLLLETQGKWDKVHKEYFS